MTKFRRMLLAIKQSRDPRCFIHNTTHEAYLLAVKAKQMYGELRGKMDFEAAQDECHLWIMGEIDSGSSKETYTRDEYLAAGGGAEDYDIIVKIQEEWAQQVADFAKRRAEFEAKEKSQAPAAE